MRIIHRDSWPAVTKGPVGGGASRPLLRKQDVHASKEGRVLLLEPMPAREVRLQVGRVGQREATPERAVLSALRVRGARLSIRLEALKPHAHELQPGALEQRLKLEHCERAFTRVQQEVTAAGGRVKLRSAEHVLNGLPLGLVEHQAMGTRSAAAVYVPLDAVLGAEGEEGRAELSELMGRGLTKRGQSSALW